MMRRLPQFLLLSLLAVISGPTNSQVLVMAVEDRTLIPVTPAVSRFLKRDPSFAALRGMNCKLIGQSVSWSDTPKQLGLFVTTDAACGWGAAIGPIWILSNASSGVRLLLATGGVLS